MRECLRIGRLNTRNEVAFKHNHYNPLINIIYLYRVQFSCDAFRQVVLQKSKLLNYLSFKMSKKV